MNRFEFLQDRLFLVSAAAYAGNRLVVRPYLPGFFHSHLHFLWPFLHSHFDDLLLMPAALPVVLWLQHRAGLRQHARPPGWREMFAHLAVWSVMCKIVGPLWLHLGTADPWDVLFFAIGGIAACLWWNRPPAPAQSHAIMNFDPLAAHYCWMEFIFSGRLMQRCRTAFLADIQNCRCALLAGEGTGKFLAELLRVNPQIEITCVEHSAGMIEQARQRLRRERLDDSRVQFKQMDALHWIPPAAKFDLVATHFFLDCFRADQLQRLVPRLAQSASADAIWLLTDFRLPERGWRRTRAVVLLAALYAFFKISTALPANWLTPPDPLLNAAGFKLADRRLANFGFAHADLWRRTPA